MSELKELLEKLSNAHGISGYEGDIREIVRSEIEDYVDEVRIDRIGNIIGTKKGKSPSVMIAAHMDEIGLMAKYVDDNGFIRFVTVGGWFDQTLLSQRVIVKGKNGPINGVIGSKPPHRMDAEERKKPIKADDMFIDIGAKDREDAEGMGVIPGSTVVIDMELKELGNGKVTGKAFDNRAGVAMMIAALKRMKTDLTVYAVGTV
ncbi:MAG: M42 family peptidase, partial [Halobacteriota archaeon]|nr:M42 family peptidase [Halobacteriota archaeon]